MIPQLKAVFIPPLETGNYGKVSFGIRWEISRNSDARQGGWVVQHLTDTWNNLECDGKQVRNPNPQDPRTKSPVKFFEAWRVAPNSKSIGSDENVVADAIGKDHFEVNYNEDEDNRPWAGNCMNGSYTKDATARYHDGVPEKAMPAHMKRNNPDTLAGDLRSSIKDPNLDGNISQPVKHNLKVHWKCCPCQTGTKCETKVDSHVP